MDGLRSDVRMREISAQLAIRMAVWIDQTLDVDEQLRVFLLDLFSLSFRCVVHTTDAAFELVDSELDGVSVPSEDRLSNPMAPSEHRYSRLSHGDSPLRMRDCIHQPRNESDHLFRYAVLLQNTFYH